MPTRVSFCQSQVAIRFRWIWVGKKWNVVPLPVQIVVAIRLRWIWDGRVGIMVAFASSVEGRNPLSLDMGWKVFCQNETG